jgi:hypothetical protein
MMYDHEYAALWQIFESWAEQDLLHPDLVVNPNRIDDLDEIIHQLFNITLESDADIHDMTVRFERQIDDKDVEWLFSEHAYALYKIKVAREQS